MTHQPAKLGLMANRHKCYTALVEDGRAGDEVGDEGCNWNYRHGANAEQM